MTGTARVGQTLTATIGTWKPALSTYSTSWSANGELLTEASGGLTLLLAPEMVGKTITFTVQALNAGYTPTTRVSIPTAPVAAGTSIVKATNVVIIGSGFVGEELTASVGNWQPAPVTFTYAWSVGGKRVDSTTNTYTPTTADLGKVVSVTVVGSHPGSLRATRSTSLKTAVFTTGVMTGMAYEAGIPKTPIAAGYAELWVPQQSPEDPPYLSRITEITNGSYTFDEVPPGKWLLQISSSATGGTAFFGGVGNPEDSPPLTVRSGQTTTTNVTLPDFASLSGKLTLGGPAQSFQDIEVYATSTTSTSYATIAPDGTFTFTNLIPGTYTLVFKSYDFSGTSKYSTQSYTTGTSSTPTPIRVAPGKAITGITFTMKPAGVVSGQITDRATGRPVAGATVVAYGLLYGSVQRVKTTLSGADGRFAFTSLEEATFGLLVEPAKGSGLAAQWIGGTSYATATKVAVKNGGTFPNRNASLVAQAVITGVVSARDTGAVFPNAFVSLYPVDAELGQRGYNLTVDSSARFTFANLPAGDYTIGFVPRQEPYEAGLYGSPEVPGGRIITVTPGQTVDLNLRAERRAY